VVLYIVCAVVGLFCILALGLGPLFFTLFGVTAAILAFTQRRRRWWGLPAATAGAAFSLWVLIGWGWKAVVVGTLVAFAVMSAVRVVGHALTSASRVDSR
jgi:hypothetical protein